MRIVIIGAGLLGVSTAWFLAKSGNEVVVIDRRSALALETSFANGGMLTPSQAAPWNTPGIAWQILRLLGQDESPIRIKYSRLAGLAGWGTAFLRYSKSEHFRNNFQKNIRLARYSLDQVKMIRQQQGIVYDHSHQGTLKIFQSREALRHARALLEIAAPETIRYELLDQQAVIALEPALEPVSDTLAGGLYFPDDEAGDAHRFCLELANASSLAGVSFLYDTTLTAMVRQGNRIQSVRTTSGDLTADLYVLAAGSYSRMLAQSINLRLPIYPVKGYSLTIDTVNTPGRLPVLPVIDELRHIAVTPLGQRLRIAGKAELAGYDTTIDSRRSGLLLKFFRQLYPELASGLEPDAIQPWTGLRHYTCDGVPLIGSCSIENLILNTGHGHLGWTLAAGSGRLIADMISGNRPGLDLTPYALSRFE